MPLVVPPSSAVTLAIVSTAASGTFTQGDWRTRIPNTITGNAGLVDTSTTASDGIFTLFQGLYNIDARASAFEVQDHICRLDVVDPVSIGTLPGQGTDAPLGVTFNSFTTLKSTLFVRQPTRVRFQQRCQTTRATVGFGLNIGGVFGTSSVYVSITLTKFNLSGNEVFTAIT